MKSLLMLLIAFLAAQSVFGQKAKAFETKANVQSVIIVGSSSTSLSPKEQMKAEVTNVRNHSSSMVIGNYSSKCPKCKEQLAINRTGSKQAVKIYTCEMHPETACNKNGDCPICHRS